MCSLARKEFCCALTSTLFRRERENVMWRTISCGETMYGRRAMCNQPPLVTEQQGEDNQGHAVADGNFVRCT